MGTAEENTDYIGGLAAIKQAFMKRDDIKGLPTDRTEELWRDRVKEIREVMNWLSELNGWYL